MRHKVFFSPFPNEKVKNDYVLNFFNALAQKFDVVNCKKRSVGKSIDVLRFSFQADIMILNWPEDIYRFRFGLLQLLISLLGIATFKLRNGRIVWVCHNRQSHFQNSKNLEKFLRWFYKKYSDFIIVHSVDALDYLSQTSRNVFYLSHPVYPRKDCCDKVTHNFQFLESDILIWGSIASYKGLDAFIDLYKARDMSYKVLIIGKAEKAYYWKLKKQAEGLNIEIQDKFVKEDELIDRFAKTKVVLLPYIGRDTFSSGALIHSLVSNKIIIGPSVGNFIDLSKGKACLTYSDADSLSLLLKSLLDNQEQYNFQLKKLQEGMQEYYNSNSWDAFTNSLSSIIS